MTKYFNLPTSNYEIVGKIIGACALCQDRLIFSKIAENCQFDPVVVLGNIGFLMSIGVVQGGMSKSLTQNGKNLASAILINDAEHTKKSWHRILSECPQTRSITTHLEINKRISKSIVIHRIALALGITLNFQNHSKMNQLLDIFEKIEILRNNDGEYLFLNFEQKIIQFHIDGSSYNEEPGWARPTITDSSRADFFDILP